MKQLIYKTKKREEKIMKKNNQFIMSKRYSEFFMVPEEEMSLRERFEMTFQQIKDLCFAAFQDGEVSSYEYFIEHGVPRSFMEGCKRCKLCAGGGKNGERNLYWNWSQNKLYPNCTVEKFLGSLPEEKTMDV